MQTLRVYNSRIYRIKNAKFSGYYFYMNTNIEGDFWICISVPLKSGEARALRKQKFKVKKIILFLLFGKSTFVTKHHTTPKVFVRRLFVPSNTIKKPISSISLTITRDTSKTAVTARALFWMWKTRPYRNERRSYQRT